MFNLDNLIIRQIKFYIKSIEEKYFSKYIRVIELYTLYTTHLINTIFYSVSFLLITCSFMINLK